MIYRILVDEYSSRPGRCHADGRWSWEAAGYPEWPRTLQGAGSCMGLTMDEHGLVAPRITNPRTRFYFTELGWARVGRHVAAAARKSGRVVRVIRRKNPLRSQIVYADAYQVALLPATARRPHGAHR